MTSEVTFRLANKADALCIGVLGTQVFLDTYAPDGIRPSLAREALNNHSVTTISSLFSDARIRFIVAERAGHMIAFAQLTMGASQPMVPFQPSVELNRLYVQEPFTGTGVGRALLAEAEAHAAAEGAAALWLTAWVGNQRALAFYQRQGYQDFGSTQYEFENEQYENRVFARVLRGESAT